LSKVLRPKTEIRKIGSLSERKGFLETESTVFRMARAAHSASKGSSRMPEVVWRSSCRIRPSSNIIGIKFLNYNRASFTKVFLIEKVLRKKQFGCRAGATSCRLTPAARPPGIKQKATSVRTTWAIVCFGQFYENFPTLKSCITFLPEIGWTAIWANFSQPRLVNPACHLPT
jgi:hypothetical protein